MSGSSLVRTVAHCFRTIVPVVIDLIRLAILAVHSRRALAAENLFLRKQLALFQERQVKPRRANDSTRWMMATLSRMPEPYHLPVVGHDCFGSQRQIVQPRIELVGYADLNGCARHFAGDGAAVALAGVLRTILGGSHPSMGLLLSNEIEVCSDDFSRQRFITDPFHAMEDQNQPDALLERDIHPGFHFFNRGSWLQVRAATACTPSCLAWNLPPRLQPATTSTRCHSVRLCH